MSELGMLEVLLNKAKTAWLDLRYGGYTGGLKPSPYASSGAKETVSTRIDLIGHLLAPVIRPGDVLVDVGCGKGRVLNWALHDGRAARIVGIELDPEVARPVRDRLKAHTCVEVRIGDARTELPDDATLFYMWNPFDATIMQGFKNALFAKYVPGGRLAAVRIVYNNCEAVDVWRSDPRCIVEPIAMPDPDDRPAVLIRFAGEAKGAAAATG